MVLIGAEGPDTPWKGPNQPRKGPIFLNFPWKNWGLTPPPVCEPRLDFPKRRGLRGPCGPVFCLCRSFPKGPNSTSEIQKRQEKADILMSHVLLNPYVLNPYLRHPEVESEAFSESFQTLRCTPSLFRLDLVHCGAGV